MGVVEAHDVVGDVSGGLGLVGMTTLPDPFRFQVQEEAFHHGVVPAISFAAHAGDQLVSGQQVTVGLTGVLATPFRRKALCHED
jgi:hypothetical protein